MKIGSYTDPKIATPAGAKQPAAPGVGVAAPSGKERAQGVSVNLSSQARSLGAAAAGSSYGEIDHAKVEAFRAAIAQGTFAVNPGAIADKLLANAQEMLDRVKR